MDSELDPLTQSFEDVDVIKVLSCGDEQIFDADETKFWEQLYQQLNPSCCVKYLSPLILYTMWKNILWWGYFMLFHEQALSYFIICCLCILAHLCKFYN